MNTGISISEIPESKRLNQSVNAILKILSIKVSDEVKIQSLMTLSEISRSPASIDISGNTITFKNKK